MKEKRSLYELIFGKKSQPTHTTQLQMLNGYIPIFNNYNGEAYENDVVRSVIDAIARNAAKLKPRHIRRIEGNATPNPSYLEKLLQVRPNPYMNGYDFMYKVITQLYMKNNSFIYIQYEAGKIVALYPVLSNTVEFVEIQNGEIYAKFQFMAGKTITLPYSELIHLRRFYYQNDLYGESNETALSSTLQLLETINDGIENGIKSSANLKGLLKFTMSQLKPEDMKRQRDDFITDYMGISNNGGIAALDAKADYIELKNEVKILDDKQMKLINDKVYKYFGVNENIIMSKYKEDEWNAFYESILEPISVQMSLEFTSKIFTQGEQLRGNEIIFESNRLQYASNVTKINLINTLMPLGLLSVNEAREIFNLGAVDDGDKRLTSLNYVDSSKANEYQLGKPDEKPIQGQKPKEENIINNKEIMQGGEEDGETTEDI